MMNFMICCAFGLAGALSTLAVGAVPTIMMTV
jgi:hypothetical protein